MSWVGSGVADRQESLACCNVLGSRDRLSNWTKTDLTGKKSKLRPITRKLNLYDKPTAAPYSIVQGCKFSSYQENKTIMTTLATSIQYNWNPRKGKEMKSIQIRKW